MHKASVMQNQSWKTPGNESPAGRPRGRCAPDRARADGRPTTPSLRSATRNAKVSVDVLHHLHMPDKLKILNIAATKVPGQTQ